MLGNDGGIEKCLKEVEKKVSMVLISVVWIECDRFVWESLCFYDEGIFFIY